MAEQIKLSGKLIRFDCVDTWKGSQYGSHPELVANLESEGKTLRGEFERNLRRADLWKYVNPIQMESVSAAETYADGSLDFVFIDADHRVAAVEADCRAWWPKLKPGGVMAGHDAQNQMVQEGIRRAFGEIEYHAKGMIWWLEPKPGERTVADTLEIPRRSPGCELWRPHIIAGCKDAGINLVQTDRLIAESHFLPEGRGRKPGEPYHVAAFDVDGRRVWFDFSDFSDWFPAIGNTYYKKQCLPDAQGSPLPAGQYIPQIRAYRSELEKNRALTRRKSNDGLAFFSNIDERNNHPLRRLLATLLLERGKGFKVGMWRYRSNRPEVPKELEARPVSYKDHLRRIARSRLVFCLPGVGGDGTRMHAETMGIGSCMVTVQSLQRWPGNFRGCWAEMRRDLSNANEVIDALLDDPDERERIAKLGRWYWETNLRPDNYVKRIAHGS
jgi:hypothetical protein